MAQSKREEADASSNKSRIKDSDEILILQNLLEKKDEEIREATYLQDWIIQYVSSLLQHSKDRKTITIPRQNQKTALFVQSFVEVINKINATLNEQKQRIFDLKKKDQRTTTSEQNRECSDTKDQEKIKTEEITSLEESMKKTIQENQHLQKSIKRSEQELSDFRKCNETLSAQCTNLQRKLKDTEKELEEIRTRLSQVAGARLTDGNSGITDLGDVYRPTKIAEMYSEIYDTEWTETMDVITKESSKWTEEQIVKHLFSVLQACYKFCNKVADEQLEEVFQKLVPNATRSDMSKYVAEAKQLKDARKGLAMIVYPSVKKMFNSYRLSELKNQTGIDSCLIEKICRTNFLNKCVMVCWLMVVQDPVMYIDDELKQGTTFNKEIYREYMKRGNVICFVVWPALFLRKNGPLLLKGVAQPGEHR